MKRSNYTRQPARFLVSLVALMVFSISASAVSNLPAEHESARLMLALESAVEQEDWTSANTQIAAIEALNVPLDNKFFYFNGLVQEQTGLPEQAQRSLEQYVVQAGKEGKYYLAALQKITALQKTEVAQEASASTSASIEPASEKKNTDGYIKSLQELYLSDSPAQALVIQINTLLGTHPYTAGRIIKPTQRQGIRYSLSVNGSDLLVQKNDYMADNPTIEVERYSVPGMDPYLRYKCSNKEYMCWVYEPGNPYEKWLLLDRDEAVVKELADALTRLIRLLQQ